MAKDVGSLHGYVNEDGTQTLRDDRQYIWGPTVCPLCARDLEQVARVLGATHAEIRKVHAEIHIKQMTEKVWDRAATTEEVHAVNKLEDWLKEEW